MYILFHSEDICRYSLEIVEKGGFWAPDLQGEGIHQTSDMHFQIAGTCGHMADFG